MQTLEHDDDLAAAPEETPLPQRARPSWVATAVFAGSAVLVAVFLLRVLGAPWPHFAVPFPESTDLQKFARSGPLHPRFWFGAREPLYPLFMWFLGRSTTLVVIAQTGLYVAAVLFLCRTILRVVRTRVAAVFAVVFVVAIAAEARTALWTTTILAESLSIAFAFALVAVWWRAAARPATSTITWAWILTGSWVLLRDTNAIVVALVIVPVVGCFALLAKSVDASLRKRAITGAAVVLALCAFAVVSQQAAHRVGARFSNGYSTRLQQDLPDMLRDDLGNFDASHVSDRLPRHFFAIFGEPRTTGGFWAEIAIAGVALAVAAIERRRRLLVLFGAAGLVAAVLDLLLSYASARSELARHLAPARTLASLVIVACIALGLDCVLARRGSQAVTEPRPLTLDRGLRWLTIVAMTGLACAALVGNWFRASAPDAQYAREIVVRVSKYGGTYFDNAVLNRGPLEQWAHSLASHISTYDGYWYTISAFIAIVSAVVAYSMYRTVVAFGAVGELGLAAAIVGFVHFALGSSAYAGVFFVRNLITMLLVIVWVIMLADRPWRTTRSRAVAAVAVGVLLGLAVQTLVTTVFVAAALALAWLAILRARDLDVRERVALTRISIVSAFAAFISAPLYYFARGDFTEFWSGYWTYATYMNRGTNRSFGNQMAMGWDQMYAYYQARPFAFAVVVGFVVVAWVTWRNLDARSRILHAGLGGWFVAAWIEMILSQRYQPQYFVITSIPVALMAAALAGHAYTAIIRARGRFGRPAAYPLIALALAIYLAGSTGIVRGVHEASSYTSVHAHAKTLRANMSGADRTMGAAFDLVSKQNDPLLAWTLQTWPYLAYHRVSATRFIWKNFLAGEIWMGGTSPDYILPETWRWFRHDIAQSKPAVFTVVDASLVPGNPFTTYVDQNFTKVFDTTNPISYRNDIARQVLDDSAGERWQPAATAAPNSGWTVTGTRARFAGDVGVGALPLAAGGCVRLEGTADDPGFVVDFTDPEREQRTTRLTLDGDKAAAGDATSEYSTGPSGAGAQTKTHFALVVGTRAAALVIGGRIRAVVGIPARATVGLRSLRPELALSGVRVGAAPAVSC
jgi:hypothetical protein